MRSEANEVLGGEDDGAQKSHHGTMVTANNKPARRMEKEQASTKGLSLAEYRRLPLLDSCCDSPSSSLRSAVEPPRRRIMVLSITSLRSTVAVVALAMDHGGHQRKISNGWAMGTSGRGGACVLVRAEPSVCWHWKPP